jgi:flagellar protein FliJ
MAFRFRLQSILKLRERDRDDAVERMRQALQAKQILLDRVTELQADRDKQSQLRMAGQNQVIDPQRYLDAQRYQYILDLEVAGLQDQIRRVDLEVEARRSVLVKCEQAVRSLEKLRDKQQEEWAAFEASRAQSRLDQWSSFRYWSNSEKE